ncbi:MAG: AAA family ATPase, partial [Helicobacteraceae bacterium]|nr:AAA family ATPase [Helicobacteraceae bacterium]
MPENKNIGKLERLYIKGYKSIKEMDINFGEINILIGANGAGKSNFIGFFRFMRMLIQKELQLHIATEGGANKLLFFGKKATSQLHFNLLFPPNGYKATMITDNADGLVFQDETEYFNASNTNYEGGEKLYSIANIGGRESNLSNKGVSGYIIKYISDWKIYHFHDTGYSSPMKQTANINDNASLAEDGKNIASFLRRIKEENYDNYTEIVDTIQRIAPFVQDFILEPETANKDTIRLKWKHKGSSDYFDASDFSDGTLRFICLTVLLLQSNKPTTILLDEPELGLHPAALNLVASLLKIAS